MINYDKGSTLLKRGHSTTATARGKTLMPMFLMTLLLCVSIVSTTMPSEKVTSGNAQIRKSLDRDTLVEGIGILFMIADLPSGDDVLQENDAIVPQSIQADPDREGADSESWDERYVRVAKELQKYDDESILLLFQLFLDSHPRFAPPGSHSEEDRAGEAFRGIPDTKLFLLNRFIYEAHAIDAPSPTFSIYTHFRFVQTGEESVEYMFPLGRNNDGKFSISKEFAGAFSVGLTRERPIEELKFFAKEFPRRRL